MVRKLNDFYPTPASVLQAVLHVCPFSGSVWEPCAGDGRFVRALEDRGNKVIGTDITSGQDFFSFKTALATVIITNPPFSLLRPFIDHAFSIGVTSMALVCPERLWACKKGWEQFNRHRPSTWVNLTWREDYLGRGGSPDRALAIAVWETPHSESCVYRIVSKEDVYGS